MLSFLGRALFIYLYQSLEAYSFVNDEVVLRLDERYLLQPELPVYELRYLFPLFEAVVMDVRIEHDHPDDCHELLEIVHEETDAAPLQKDLRLLVCPPAPQGPSEAGEVLR